MSEHPVERELQRQERRRAWKLIAVPLVVGGSSGLALAGFMYLLPDTAALLLLLGICLLGLVVMMRMYLQTRADMRRLEQWGAQMQALLHEDQ